MDQIIDNFIKSKDTAHGYGFFKYERSMNDGEKGVVDFANDMGKCQLQKYKRYQVVPGAFISYFRYLGIIPEGLEIPKDKRTTKGFTDLLCKSGKNISHLGDFIKEQRETRLKNIHPEMRKMFVSGEKLGKDLDKYRHGLPLKNNTKIKTLRNLAAR